MLFNSLNFILVFLPITFFGMIWLGKYSRRLAALWLSLASLSFYAVWDARFVLLLLISISFNYGAGYWIGLRRATNDIPSAKAALVLAISANMLLLGYFKYANFFITSVNQLTGTDLAVLNILLPLGISFFTFTQIAFLVDVYRGFVREYNYIHYLLFVTWFPHLIAGPILHHKQMMPQFSRPEVWKIHYDNVAAGLTIFVLGLAKKVLIADDLANFATPVFTMASNGSAIQFFDAWVGALAYTLQLYFDFSAYSDMAIGLSLMFNVRLPLNFDSPYKATSIIDFWRRWHITLSTFLRDYLYIPLGGNRKGTLRRYLNLMATMLLGGLWHGAGWTFIIWGGLHGIYLMINHGWREFKTLMGLPKGGRLAGFWAGVLTFLSVVVAWVFFRADSLHSAQNILYGMAGLNGISLPPTLEARLAPLLSHQNWFAFSYDGLLNVGDFKPSKVFRHLLIGLAIVWFLPNVRQIMRNHKPVWDDFKESASSKRLAARPNWLIWRPLKLYALGLGALLFVCLTSMSQKSEFLYFQF